MATPCYLYWSKEKKWVWLDEAGEEKPWEDGWKRRPKKLMSSPWHWLEKYPGRRTALPDPK
jgi:hypothetical protein